MAFIPHTKTDISQMLATIGAKSVEDLFDEIPAELKVAGLDLPEALSEMAILRLMRERARLDKSQLNFVGAGAYEHHIPAAVWDIVSRGEFYSAYTPYQAEASQGTLQLLYEYQSMMASLTGMDAANASLYDGASSLAEAVLMSVRLNRRSKSRRILVLGALHPAYRETIHTLVSSQKIELVDVPFNAASGTVQLSDLESWQAEDITAVIISQPNFLGQLEAVNELTDWAHRQQAIVIAAVNPTALALLHAPGQWGEKGADIACGEGQPLGVPLASGGPYCGFMTCKIAHVRQMPGRIIGRTTDLDGKEGFALTLQAREQHIRRAKATSNICTNQSLLVTATTIYLALLGYKGLKQVATHSCANTRALAERICQIPGVEQVYSRDNSFHEVVIRLPISAKTALSAMSKKGILAGYDLGRDYSTMGHCLLVCATETKTAHDLEQYYDALLEVLKAEGVSC
ncbi:putative glycine dehydrogenase [decarboxylating] subunit 1 [Piscirickettsia salmonis]|uniref:aminomethyl-transferring glycine dehydrogenase subunit GcvPA n=1 Tax=Piscirickettsia salmonis TaxID=1238 RepID=UPI0012BAED83|nr:aminomethyl-transferring glycine dehydrogenase subunit GcvPA [Piscirickettsia salmonis]QGP53679.1 putative glycine dehydrogenase [decarboxylating] subunit 1 [Piscirickettsia salmonis]QGP60414.1 putative glycine dehydrogenase [decarboxylating] subunit 1 [Piscirickettsia salmonis]QGP63245.1 putative glycine dehydrogenase [decarboxylating] subunit 1 [Piscirickettsia salmonis]